MILGMRAERVRAALWLLPADAGTLEEAVASEEWESGRALADELPGRIIDLLASKGLALTDLSGIIVFAGPESFTSLRIAHAVASSLASGLDVPAANATGDDWARDALRQLPEVRPGAPVLPEYGGEANTTVRRS